MLTLMAKKSMNVNLSIKLPKECADFANKKGLNLSKILKDSLIKMMKDAGVVIDSSTDQKTSDDE